MIFFLCFSVLLNVSFFLLLFRASKRLLQFDLLLGQVAQTLFDYGTDIRNVVKEGVLQDHPEIVSFHRRNVRALAEIDAAVKTLEQVKPRKIEPPKGNPPVWE